MSRVPRKLAFSTQKGHGCEQGTAARFGITTEWIADEEGHTRMMRYVRGDYSATIERNPLDDEIFIVYCYRDGEYVQGEPRDTLLRANALVRTWLLDASERQAIHGQNEGRTWCARRPAKRYQTR